MEYNGKICFYCCLEKGRKEGCEFCGSEAAGREVERHPIYLPSGTILENKYLVGRVLGHGGFGITYIGFDRNLRQRVAIKEYMPRDLVARSPDGLGVLPFSGGAGDEFELGMQKFIGEGRALARFADHPNIISVANYFEANGTAYIVMRYLEGVSLAEHLMAQGSRLSEEETIRIATMTLDGLRVVHKGGMLHRDVKPHNIFLTHEGIAKLIDFGSARKAMGEQSRSLTKIVSDGYAPFEQYIHNGKEGPWTDLYAVGATIHHCLSGERPVPANERMVLDEYKPLRAFLGDKVSRSISDLVARAISLDATKRFQSVEEMLNALAGGKNSSMFSASNASIENFQSDSDIKDTFIKSPHGQMDIEGHHHIELQESSDTEKDQGPFEHYLSTEDMVQEIPQDKSVGEIVLHVDPNKLTLKESPSLIPRESPVEKKERERRLILNSKMTDINSQILEIGRFSEIAKEGFDNLLDASVRLGVNRKEAVSYIEDFCKENRIKLFKDVPYSDLLHCTKCEAPALPSQNVCPECYAPLSKGSVAKLKYRSWESSEIWLIALVIMFICVAGAMLSAYWDEIFSSKNKTSQRVSYTAPELWDKYDFGKYYSIKGVIEVTGRISKDNSKRKAGFLSMSVYEAPGCSDDGDCIIFDVKEPHGKANSLIGKTMTVACKGTAKKELSGYLLMSGCYFP